MGHPGEPPEPLPHPATSAGARIEQALATAAKPLSRRELRRACRMRSHTLGQSLAALVAQGRVLRDEGGYRLP